MPDTINIQMTMEQPQPVAMELLLQAGPVISMVLAEPELPSVLIELGNIGPKGDSGEGTAAAKPAGQDTSSGRVIYIDNGEAKYFDPSDQSLAGKAIGITKNAALTGDNLNIVSAGVCLISGWGLTPGTVYYAGPNGTMVTSISGLAVVQRVGAAISTNELVINFSSPIITN